ncbi:MaoC family dehydratase [Sulfobacillus sp. DSM 109850]|uniref:MaoC family dehydratase n=2 Tax=Sulfobacillus harzensis TaxID=2729629 RepID=A0A7Y0L121_9FIRM|nr:MaoC family dehydratase [Sulfobacillus harzensis]
MLFQEEKIGQRSQPITHEVERGAIRRFARALGLTSAIHQDVASAQAAGFRDLVAPPTFVVTLLPWQIPGLTLPSAGVLHGEQEFWWGEPICAGDQIQVTGWVEDVKTRSGKTGRMHIITIASEGMHQDEQPAFRARAVLIVTEEAENASRG